jgi:AcrR family transcriptional regulator
VEAAEKPRRALTRDRVLQRAVELADEHGIEAVTMRRLGQELGVEAMSLYNHVSNKDDIVGGIVEVVAGEIVEAVSLIEPPDDPAEWKAVTRRRILAAREVMLRHRWAPAVLETRTDMPMILVGYYDTLLGMMRAAGFSLDLAHHALHAIGSRALGFSQELFVQDDKSPDPDTTAIMIQQMSAHYPHLADLLKIVNHDDDSTIGGCDDQFEFEFGLDLILDGLERLRDRGWQLPATA